jgi:hypothetical protein
MQLQTLERRLELLRLEGNGLTRPEIVEELTQKFGCSKDTVWYDLRTKPRWQPVITEIKQALLTIINRHEQLYRKASLAYMKAGDNKEKMLAVNLMKNINAESFDMLQSSGFIEKAPDKIESLNKNLTIIRMWQPDDSTTDADSANQKGSLSEVLPVSEAKKLPQRPLQDTP